MRRDTSPAAWLFPGGFTAFLQFLLQLADTGLQLQDSRIICCLSSLPGRLICFCRSGIYQPVFCDRFLTYHFFECSQRILPVVQCRTDKS